MLICFVKVTSFWFGEQPGLSCSIKSVPFGKRKLCERSVCVYHPLYWCFWEVGETRAPSRSFHILSCFFCLSVTVSPRRLICLCQRIWLCFFFHPHHARIGFTLVLRHCLLCWTWGLMIHGAAVLFFLINSKSSYFPHEQLIQCVT